MTGGAVTGGAVVWLTGLPASGKSTLAGAIVAALRARGREPLLLDSDEVRTWLVPAPGYDATGRDGFYRTLAALAGGAAGQGLVVVVAATAHRRVWRELARSLAPRLIEVHVDTPLAECRRRDPKGLYRAGPDSTVPGVGVEYEPPLAAEVIVRPGDEAGAISRVVAIVSEN